MSFEQHPFLRKRKKGVLLVLVAVGLLLPIAGCGGGAEVQIRHLALTL